MPEKLIEIARSYTRKVNTGNFESFDVFCSAKEEVEKKNAEKTSEELFEFCRKEVLKSIKEHKLDLERGEQLEKIEPLKKTFELTEEQKALVKKSTKELNKQIPF